MEKYVPLKNHYHWLFKELVAEPITEGDLSNIRAFSEEFGSKYWTDNICSESHLQIAANLYYLYYGGKKDLQPEGSWIHSLKEADYNWEDDYNNDNIQRFATFLSSLTNLPDNEKIVYFWCKGSGLETTWGVFKRNWIGFLYDDESPILLCPRTGFAIRFGPTGTLYIGYKTEPIIEYVE